MKEPPPTKKDEVVVHVRALDGPDFSASETSLCPEGAATPSEDDADYYPEGGSVAWRQVVAGHFMLALGSGYAATFGVYQLYYEQTLAGTTSAQVSWIGSVQTFINAVMCLPAGRLADAGYARLTVLVGSALTFLGTLMTSFATEYYQIFLAQGVCTGIGLGFLFMPAFCIISSYFKQRRTLALGIAGAGTATGSMAFPAVVQYLMPVIGFAWAVRCCALIVVLMCGIINLLLKPRPTVRKPSPIVEWGAFKELSYVLFLVGAWLFYWALYFGFFYINTYARNITGFTDAEAVNLLLIVNATGLVMRPLGGYMADRVGALNAFIITSICFGAVLFGWAGVTTTGAMYAFAVLFGVTNSAAQSAFLGATTTLTTDPQRQGARSGMIFLLDGVSSLLGPPTAGALIDAQGGRYLAAQIWGGSVVMASAVALVATRWWQVGMKLNAKL